MSELTTLSTWLFGDEAGAQRATYRLETGHLTESIIDDAGVVSWPPERARPVAWQARNLGGVGQLSGAFWGLLFGSLFLLPLTRPSEDADILAADPATIGATETLRSLGLDASFSEPVREHVRPGTSALFVLTPNCGHQQLSTALPPGTTCIAQVVLSGDHQRRIHAGFDD